ncbi:MAG: AMP-binding protein [Peptococcaceae bacterium]|jgi:long-chain acyl-CoA synthetase|nr:AMP-binding protein [Peptococcaceae bacterium]
MKSNLSYVKFDPGWSLQDIPPLPDLPVYEILRQSADRWPHKTALVCLGRNVTFAELDKLTDQLARSLTTLGVRKGDRVATMLPNCIQHTIAYFAINKAGAVAMPVNVMYKEKEIEYQLKDSACDTIIALDSFYPLVEKVRKNAPIANVILTNLKDFAEDGGDIPRLFASDKRTITGTHDFTALLAGQEASPLSVDINPDDDLSLLLYTAGTTGVSKGVMLSHKNIWAAAHPSKYIFDLTEDDVDMQVMPMFHASGYCLLQLPVLYAGGTVVLIPLFHPEDCLKLIDELKVTIIFAPPSLFIALLNHPGFPDHDLRGVRTALSCGAPLPRAVKEKWDAVTGQYLYDGYGLTETTAQGTAVLSMPLKRKPGAVGVVIGGELKVINDNGETVPRGTTGEVMFRGDGVAKGYWHKPEETEKSFTADGWLHTGDAAYLDEEDFLYFVDRYKDLIITSGYNVAPLEVENVIMRHPGVIEASVIGVPDEYKGEAVVAYVSLKGEYRGKVSGPDIIAHCRRELATFKVPRVVEFLEEMPKNAVGKVLRRQLREINQRSASGGEKQ